MLRLNPYPDTASLPGPLSHLMMPHIATRFFDWKALAAGRRLLWGLAWAAWALQAQGAQSASASAGAPSAAVQAPCPPQPSIPSPEELQALSAQAQDRGFLWRLEKGGKSSYLYGTLHLGRREWLVPGPRTRAALQEADVVAVELDTQDPAILEGIHKGLAPTAGRAWPEPLRERLKAQLQQSCLPDTLVASLSPEMLATTLVVMSGRHDGLHAAYGIDPVLAALARQMRKRVISLETPELQARALRELIGNSSHNLDAMLQSLENGEARRILLRTSAAWSQSQSPEFEHYDEWCECMRNPQERALMKRMLDDRNPHLARGIAREHAQGRVVFAAVGSLHLFGPRSLPKLLAEQGFQVSAVPLRGSPAATP